MPRQFIHRLILLSVTAIPVSSLDGWVQLKFNKIPANEVSIQDGAIKVSVNESASPLVHKLPQIKKISKMKADLAIQGSLSSQTPSTQDLKFPEDSQFRLGLVAQGERTLNWFQRKIAADWVLKLFQLAPPGVGLDKIYFYNLADQQKLVGKQREHPSSDLIFEKIVNAHAEGPLRLEHKLETPLQVVALWISIDGDDTKSKFATMIKSIELE